MSITENNISVLEKTLQQFAGTDHVFASSQATANASIDGKASQAVVEPGDAEAASEILKLANEQNLKVAIRGGGTKLTLGNPISDLDIVLSTQRLNAVLEHVPADLTIGLQAGAKLQEVQDYLEKYEQFLPLESPLAREATVGGAVAANTSGSLRLQYGPVRDWLIGVKFVLADGTPAKGGGRVVKNVAGFDMMKIFTGSLGTLGLITEMNFKLMPLPAAATTSLLTMPDEKIASSVALKIIRAGLFPSALTILDSRGAKAVSLDNIPTGQCVLAVTVRNTKQAMERQIREIYQLTIDEVGKPVLYTDLTERPAQKEWQRQQTDFAYRPELQPESSFALKLATLPTNAVAAIEMARHIAANYEIETESMSYVGYGISYITGQSRDNAAILKIVNEVTAKIQQQGGTVTAERVPLEVKQQLPDVWGTALTEGELKLMRGVKAQLDPKNTLNPGRFVGRI